MLEHNYPRNNILKNNVSFPQAPGDGAAHIWSFGKEAEKRPKIDWSFVIPESNAYLTLPSLYR